MGDTGPQSLVYEENCFIEVHRFSAFTVCHHSLPFRARNDCMQWFTGLTGSVSSLNYPNVLLDDVAYTICIRREAGMCAINWSEAATTTDAFDLDDTETEGSCVSLSL